MRQKIIFVLCLFLSLMPVNVFAKNIHIVTTIKPLESLIKNIIDKDDSVTSIIDGNYSPHNFSLKPSHIAKIYKSDAVILINPDFESFMCSSFKIIPEKTKLITLSDTPNLTLYPSKQYHHGTHKETGTDYHIWLSADNAIHIVRYLTDTLSTINPEKQKTYRDNAHNVITKLVALNDDLKQQLSPITDKPFMVFHNGFEYFIKNYNLSLVGTITDNPNVYSSIKHIKQAQKTLIDNKVICVFKEPQFSDKTIETIITDTQTRISTLDPIGSNFKSGKNLYFKVMHNIKDNLLTCLKPE